MAELIKLFELDIDTDAVIKRSQELKTNLDGVTRQLKRLKDAGDTSSEGYIQMAAAQKSLRSEYNSSQQQLAKLISIQGKEIKTVEQGRNALSVINKEWTKQASLYGTNSKQAEQLAKKTTELRGRLKELEAGVGDTSRNVGNYSEGVQDALGKTTIFGRASQVVNQIVSVAKPIYNALKLEVIGVANSYKLATASTTGLTKAQKAQIVVTNLTTAALKLFKIALISTGIGAVLILLGSLIAFFSRTQKGVDLVSKAMAVFGTVMDVIIDRLSAVGGALVKILSGDFAEGFRDLTNAASGLGDELIREANAALELENALIRLADREIDLITTQATRKKQIEELRIAAKDELKDLNERANLLEQAGEIEKQVLADELEVAKERARISQEKLDLGESTRDDIKANAELQAAVTELEINSLKKQRSLEAEKQGLQKRARAQAESFAKAAQKEREKAINDAIKENETRLKLFIELNEGKAQSLEENVKFQEDIRDRELEIIKEKVEAGKLTEIEAELEKLKIKKEFLEIQKELVVEFASEELAVFRSANQSRLDENALLTQELVNQEVERLSLISEKQKEFQAVRLANGEINEREYQESIDAVNAEFRAARAELNTELEEIQKEKDLIDFENQQALRVERDNLIFEAKLAQLDRDREAEIAAAEAVGANIALIEQRYANLRNQIKEQEVSTQLGLQADLFGGVAQLLGKQSAAAKTAGVAQAFINTFQGVTEVWKTKSVLPEPLATAARVVNTGVVLGSGLKAVQKIRSTNANIPRAEKGALFQIGGKRHSAGGTRFKGEDGTEFEAERGELIGVMNRRASQAFMQFNDQYTSGRMASGSNYFADGGIVQRSIEANTGGAPVVVMSGSNIDYDRLGQEFMRGASALPPPVTDVKDVIDQVGQRNNLVDGADF